MDFVEKRLVERRDKGVDPLVVLGKVQRAAKLAQALTEEDEAGNEDRSAADDRSLNCGG